MKEIKIKNFRDTYELATYYIDKWDIAYSNGGDKAALKVRMQFKKALLKHVGLSNHPKAEKVWKIAFERNQDFGYEEVARAVEDFADVLKDD